MNQLRAITFRLIPLFLYKYLYRLNLRITSRQATHRWIKLHLLRVSKLNFSNIYHANRKATNHSLNFVTQTYRVFMKKNKPWWSTISNFDDCKLSGVLSFSKIYCNLVAKMIKKKEKRYRSNFTRRICELVVVHRCSECKSPIECETQLTSYSMYIYAGLIASR